MGTVSAAHRIYIELRPEEPMDRIPVVLAPPHYVWTERKGAISIPTREVACTSNVAEDRDCSVQYKGNGHGCEGQSD